MLSKSKTVRIYWSVRLFRRLSCHLYKSAAMENLYLDAIPMPSCMIDKRMLPSPIAHWYCLSITISEATAFLFAC